MTTQSPPPADTVSSDSAIPEQDPRTRMLQYMQDDWIQPMQEQSLYREMLRDLGRESPTDAIQYPFDMILQRSEQADTPLPAGTRLVDMFDTWGGELLILGAAGAGKTTMLFELAHALIERAQQDETHPIPVVFNLSTWTAFVTQHKNKAKLAVWLEHELVVYYGVSQRLAHEWIAHHQILPLLDGLDEVPQAHQASCIEAINAYRNEHSNKGLVVCCRTAEHAAHDKLTLPQAVTLQPLSEQQIDDYLAQVGAEVATIRTMMQQDDTLRTLANTPLMLSLIVLAYRGADAAALPTTGSMEERQQQVFERYVQHMLRRPSQGESYRNEQTTRWLSWLAARMQQHGQTVFSLDQMQPDWLGKGGQRWLYNLFNILTAALVGGIFGSVLYALMSVGSRADAGSGAIFGFFLASAFGLVIGLGSAFSPIRTTETLQPWKKAIEPKTRPDDGIRRSLRSAFLGGSLIALPIILGGLLTGEANGLFWGLPFGAIGGLSYGTAKGGAAFAQHGILRQVLAVSNTLPANLVPFLEYARARGLLRRVGCGYVFVHRLLMEYFAGVGSNSHG